jgi:hypothetical protein
MSNRFFGLKVSALGFSSLSALLLLCARFLLAAPSQAQSVQDLPASEQSQLKDDDDNGDDDDGESSGGTSTTTTTTTTVTQLPLLMFQQATGPRILSIASAALT